MAIGLLIGGYALYMIATGNFHEVAKDTVYRSAQLSAVELSDAIRQHGIKSVLNLRGENTGKSWYDEEVAVCKRTGVAHYDIPLSAGRDVSAARMDEIVSILKQAPKPLLIHCKSGADRAAFGSALYEFAVEGRAPKDADNELTIWYGHIPMITPHVAAMDRSYWHYVERAAGTQVAK
jgi:protein tyrosine/serine phosphatase